MSRFATVAIAGSLACAAFALAGFLFFVAPGMLVSDARIEKATGEALAQEQHRLKARNDVRTAGIQLVGVLAIVVGSVLTWRTVRVTREGQITDRYAKAIENLDDEKSVPTQLGAVYALERIARDSRVDHWPVMELLVGYLRKKADPPPVGSPEGPVSVKPEVQAVLTVLARRRSRRDPRNSVLRLEGLDLRVVRMTGADLRRANLSGSNLSGAFLEHVRLDSAQLHSTVLRGALLDFATGRNAVMKGADFTGAQLPGVDFRGADHSGAVFANVDRSQARGLPDAEFKR
jgi:hypothetical protein